MLENTAYLARQSEVLKKFDKFNFVEFESQLSRLAWSEFRLDDENSPFEEIS